MENGKVKGKVMKGFRKTFILEDFINFKCIVKKTVPCHANRELKQELNSFRLHSKNRLTCKLATEVFLHRSKLTYSQ